ncbi:YbaY family lipoprotein [Chitinibacter tainanensis]|uniref:YbaY family lipoprotein n=1 Tax=Chitinibacter tainanensis TaxID=230667 RepID=UPI002357C00A|nr:YbaY family lipoprotein [Chitinibacter tainanensis]
MKTCLLWASLLLAAPSWAQLPAEAIYRCAEGEVFQLQHQPNGVRLWRGLYQPVKDGSRLNLASTAAGEFSDGEYRLHSTEQTLSLFRQAQPLGSDCRPAPQDEPVNPVRDAASGIVFVPPERWLAQEVKLTATSGSELPADAAAALQRLSYWYQAADGRRSPLLTLTVYPGSVSPLPNGPADSMALGTDTQRVYYAKIKLPSTFAANTPEDARLQALRLTEAELRQAFSMYGVVVNRAVETVTVIPSWLERNLRPGALQRVELRELTGQGLGQRIAVQERVLERGNPIPLTLRFDPAAINPKLQYVVQAQLLQNGRVVMQSETAAVLTQQHGREARVLLKSLR